MRVVVSTCDRYDHLLPGFAMQWNRYWGTPVTILGFRQPPELPPNFAFISMAQNETMSWSAHIRSAIAKMDDGPILFIFDDYWLTSPVNTDKVDRMCSLVLGGCAKGDLSRNTSHFSHVDLEDGLVEATAKAQYRTSTQPAIWSRSYLLSTLGTGEYNPWQFEMQTDPVIREGRVVGTHEQIVEFANIYYKGEPAPYMIDKIPVADLAALHASGAMDAIKPIVC